MNKIILVVLMMVFFIGCGGIFGPSMRSRQAYIDSHAFLTQRTSQYILDGKVCRGMTTGEVVASWGRPNDINITVGSWGRHEQWIYGSGINASYLYFENGILTSIQY